VPWDCDNPMWQIWAVMGEAWAAWVDPNGFNLWTSALPTWPFAFIGGVVNTPPYVYRMYPDESQDPNLSETFFSKEKSHYELAHVRWINADKGEGVLGQHVSQAGWTGMFLGIQKHPGETPYVYMHCAPDGGLTWYGPGGSYNLNLAEGVWILFAFDADGDTSVPNAPAGVPLWKSAVWEGDKYANAPTAWNDANYVMVSRADTGQPLVYKNFGSWKPEPSRYRFHEKGISLLGVYAVNAEDLPAWIVSNHVECRGAEFSPVARNLDLYVVKPNYGSVDVCPALPHPNDPNLPDQREYRYTDGTEIVLAAQPINGKSFGGWAIWTDPSKYPDPNFMSTDSNSVLYLTMDQDYAVEATFKCGSGLPPFVAVVLLTLGLAVVIRRLW